MKTFFERPTAEQETIRAAYEWEIAAIEQDSTDPNPYIAVLQSWGLWEALNEAVEAAYAH